MAGNRRVYDSRHLQADCQEPGSAPEPYARQSSMDYHFSMVSANGYAVCRLATCQWPGSTSDNLRQ